MKNMLLAFVCFTKVAACCARQAGRETAVAIYSAGSDNPFAALYRPAGLAGQQQVAAGIQLEQRFMLRALNVCSIVAVMPCAAGAFGLLATSTGNSAYREQEYALGYGRTLGNKLRVGVLFDYRLAGAAGYGKSSAIGCSAGILYQLSEKCRAGMHLLHPVSRSLQKAQPQGLPVMYTTGIGYNASPQCRLGVEIRKEEQRPASAVFTCEYAPLPQFSCLAGIATAPQFSYAGVTCIIGKVRAGLSGSYHPQLGITPNLVLIWQQKR